MAGLQFVITKQMTLILMFKEASFGGLLQQAGEFILVSSQLKSQKPQS
jgi:hypothetical protein